MLYNRRTASVKHYVQELKTIEAQRAQCIPIWYYSPTVSYSQSDNRTEVETPTCQLGSVINYHKIDHTLSPSNPEFPNHYYWALLKFSYADLLDPLVTGQGLEYDNHADDAGTIKTTNIPRLKDVLGVSGTVGDNALIASWEPVILAGNFALPTNLDSIRDIHKHDYLKHFLNVSSKQTVYDDNYLFSTRRMRIPGKVKRINPGTFYGLWIFNDNVRPTDDADTTNVLTYDLRYEFNESIIL